MRIEYPPTFYQFQPKVAALLNRFLSEDCEKIDKILCNYLQDKEALTETDKSKLKRVLKPLTSRELEKWGAKKDWTAYHVSQITQQLRVSELFEMLLDEN